MGVNWPFKEAPALFTYRQPDRLWTQMEKPKSGHHRQKKFFKSGIFNVLRVKQIYFLLLICLTMPHFGSRQLLPCIFSLLIAVTLFMKLMHHRLGGVCQRQRRFKCLKAKLKKNRVPAMNKSSKFPAWT